jgi:hypothetical protein
MTILDAEAIKAGADEDILLVNVLCAAYCVLSSPVILESPEEGYVSTPLIRRYRKTIEGLLEEYGERHFERAYRMSFTTFCDLHTLLHTSILSGAPPNHTGGLPRICTKIRLAAAIRFFAGGSVWDIMISHGMSRTETYDSVWMIVDAVNNQLPMLVYPASKEEQSTIASGFVKRQSTRRSYIPMLPMPTLFVESLCLTNTPHSSLSLQKHAVILLLVLNFFARLFGWFMYDNQSRRLMQLGSITISSRIK